jgi:hypothetical protein
LLLDSVLNEFLAILERRPDLFLEAADEDKTLRRRNRIRRRALRQGWLLRRRYEEHAVPDLPTSPGENMRVLPSSHPRVPQEQITQPARRTRRLYADDPLLPRLRDRVALVLRQSLRDLEDAEEWRELGLGVFLDRPFGLGKAAAEPDGTLLLSAEAFSISIALQRLLALAGDLGVNAADALIQNLLARPPLHGLPLDAIAGAVRPGRFCLSPQHTKQREGLAGPIRFQPTRAAVPHRESVVQRECADFAFGPERPTGNPRRAITVARGARGRGGGGFREPSRSGISREWTACGQREHAGYG